MGGWVAGRPGRLLWAAGLLGGPCGGSRPAGAHPAPLPRRHSLRAPPALATDLHVCPHPLTRRRRKYKDEVARLSQALKSASAGSRATDKAADRAAKEVDKLR